MRRLSSAWYKKNAPVCMNNIVVIESTKKQWTAWKNPLHDTLSQGLVFLKRHNLFLEVFLISDIAMQRLNKKYRGKDMSTNVISFPYTVPFPIGPHKKNMRLGELYLAPHYITTHREDYRVLAIHGLLHILGYTHDTDRAMMKMERVARTLESQML